MMRSLIAFIALALPAIAFSAEPGPSQRTPPLPPLVEHIKTEIADTCRGNATFGNTFIKVANFSPDGKPDYILYKGAVSCPGDGVMSGFCGNQGCGYEFVVSEGFTYRREEMYLRQYEIIPRPDGDILKIAQHGTACGRVGASECDALLFWRRGKFSARN
jgi:hypothetical protein